MNIKPILAIETSGNLCGAAVYFDHSKYFEIIVNFKNSHSGMLFDVIDKTLNFAGIQLKDLECIAVSSGPGSFTGLRIGYSAVKGLAFGSLLQVCPVPTFEALALQILRVRIEGGDFIIANKVNVEEVYYARFHIKSNNYIFAEKLQIINISELLEKSKGYPIFGNAINKDNEYSAPRPLYVAEWCILYGAEYKTFNYDLLEPNYFKNFIVKEFNK
jgi:tRNA threonylcarbamoyladenosine biosynthesis protein TsaB